VSPRRPDLWTEAFLLALARSDGKIRVAADLAGIHRAQVYRRMNLSPKFRSEVQAVFASLRSRRSQRAAEQEIFA